VEDNDWEVSDLLTVKIKNKQSYRDTCEITIIGKGFDVGEESTEYICYVPEYEHISDSFIITNHHVNWYGLEQKYLGEKGIFVTRQTSVIKHKKGQDGALCCKCKNFIQWAPRNNKYYICRSCKINPY
jgi:hypothetical protein